MNHEVVEISSTFVDSPDVVLVIECTCGEIYRFTKEFHPEWNMWTRSYYTDAVSEAYCVLCPKEDPMEKRAVVLTEKEKEAHATAKQAAEKEKRTFKSQAEKRRYEYATAEKEKRLKESRDGKR